VTQSVSLYQFDIVEKTDQDISQGSSSQD